jgi:hypothetical protein
MQTGGSDHSPGDNQVVGIGLWLLSGLAASALARNVPLARPPRAAAELLVGLTAAFLLGLLATAMDFGGWKELDWRAALFVFLGTLAALGASRLVRR